MLLKKKKLWSVIKENIKIPNVDFCPRWEWGRDRQTDREKSAGLWGHCPLKGIWVPAIHTEHA